MDTKQVKTEFGDDCDAIDRTGYSMASVNEMFGMTENYPGGLQMMLLGR